MCWVYVVASAMLYLCLVFLSFHHDFIVLDISLKKRKFTTKFMPYDLRLKVFYESLNAAFTLLSWF